MSSQALQAELNTLLQEVKRKNPDIRNAAEKSLQDLKSLTVTSEQQLAADLSRRPHFIDPFILSCTTRNPKYAASAAVCLQRLVIIRGLPKTRLKDVLDALNACTSLNTDIQLKVLQALPALAQNYINDLKGEQLAAALQVCAALQNAKAPTVSGVATATLQQLVVSVLDKVAAEDVKAFEVPTITEVPGHDGPIALREAAFDAYRVLLDICLTIEGRKPRFVQFSELTPSAGLELVWTCLSTHSKTFASHPEQTDVIRTVLMPIIIRSISERQGFGITLRAVRVASLVLRQHLQAMPEECEVVLGLLTHMLDPEAAALWKRAMCMEIFRLIYTEPGLALQIYLQFDAAEGHQSIIRDNIAVFVRLATEKPSVIGLGQQSTVPTGPPNQKEANQEQAIMEAAGGVAGVISVSLGASEVNIPGLSAQWSTPKTQCIDQLDKSEPPALPESYIYSLVMECLNGLSDNLAKVILPMTVQSESTKGKKQALLESDVVEDVEPTRGTEPTPRTRTKRSQSYRARTVPLNPLLEENSQTKATAIANLIEECWPALLATYSTFLYAALDNDYYRALIRSFQRFVQVAGLLRLSTARDAFLTTLGKSAVPPNVISASLTGPLSPTEGNSLYANAKGLLSAESFGSQSSINERLRRSFAEPTKPVLTNRNLLCLRALLNVAIAIGPILEGSFTIIIETLQQAGVVLNSLHMHQNGRDGKTSSGLAAEVGAVESASLRLFESTADYPNDAFIHVLGTFCRLLDGNEHDRSAPSSPHNSGSPMGRPRHSRQVSNLPGISTNVTLQPQDYLFVLTRLGELSDLNVARFASYSAAESGWQILVVRLIDLSVTAEIPSDARRLAADILTRCAISIAELSTSEDEEEAGLTQKLVFSSLHKLVQQLYAQSDELTNVDIEIHAKVLAAVRSILENSGEALTVGWETILAITSTVFDDDYDEDAQPFYNVSTKQDQSWLHLSSQLIASSLGRSAFGVIQLVCSDFLNILPSSCLSPLIELLYHFTSQATDLNISLTSVALFWDVSDSLVKQNALNALNEHALEIVKEDEKLTHQKIVAGSQGARHFQWILLFFRLADTISDDRHEVRNSALQTLFRMFKNHGDELSTPAWNLIINTLFLKILREIDNKQRQYRSQAKNAEAIVALDSTSRNVLENISALLSEYLAVMAASDSFSRLWGEFISILKLYTSHNSFTLDAAVFDALSLILRTITATDGTWKDIVDIAASLWASQTPTSSKDARGQDAEQDAYNAYTDYAIELYRLRRESTPAEDISTLATNLLQCVRSSKGAAYAIDASNPTPLQVKVLTCLKSLRTDIDSVPSILVKTASEFVLLPFDETDSQTSKPRLSYVALSKAAMDWLSLLLPEHLSSGDLFRSEAVAMALESFSVPIKLKYQWKQNGKAPPPWQKATTAALTIVDPVLKHMQSTGLEDNDILRIWNALVDVAQAIMNANLTSTSLPPLETVEQDEDFDRDNLTRLKTMMTSPLSSTSIPDVVREKYVSSLFHASIIHQPERGDIPSIPLTNLRKLRLGRVWDPEPTPREEMAYLCLNELISLSAQTDGDAGSLAQAAAPWLVLRFALPIKAYIADQPLRGSMPQPLSQKEELLFCLEEMRRSSGGNDGSVDDDEVEDERDVIVRPRGREGKGVPQLRNLRSLVVKAVGVAGGRMHGNREVLAALQRVLEVDSY